MSVEIYGTERFVNALFDARAVGFDRGKARRFASKILSPGAYINNRNLPSHPEAWKTVIEMMTSVAKRLLDDYDVIAAVATGGIVHGAVIAYTLGVPHIIVKKEEKNHGLGGRIDGDIQLLHDGARVLLVEDMYSTFESSLEAIEVLTQEGARDRHTLLIITWNFPAFRYKFFNHTVIAGCIGEMILDKAVARGQIEERYEKLLRHWLQHPDDESWSQDGTWQLPKSKTE